MAISIWWTGKTVPDYLKSGIDEYLKRISHFEKIDFKEFRESKGIHNKQLIIESEEKALKIQLSKTKYNIILLDERGTAFTSVEFAKWLDHKLHVTNQNLCFIIGGAYGFSDEFKNSANELISFSKMTMSHQLIRLVFTEQLYRAFTIINHLPYHHD
jgi:23S rRNA (pseudouridine1915-N3)-methyltransferase